MRAKYFEQFASGEETIMVCTDIASRGLDTIKVECQILICFGVQIINEIL